jgi:hypothetical protein
MKKVSKLTGILVLLILGLSACQQITTVEPTPTTTNTVQQGSWKITSYIDSGKDETSHFSGYIIAFGNNGLVTAVKSSSNINGTWTKGNDDSKQKLILNFGEIFPFDELSDDWTILEESAVIIRLQDISNGNGGTDLLTLEKI